MARTTLPSTITSLLLLFLLSPPPLSSATDTTVVDYFGKPVTPGASYYFFFPGTGYFFGSLTMISKPNQPECPKYVSVSNIPNDFGPGVEFYPTDPSQETITVSTNLNVIFTGSSNCSGKPVWRLTKDSINGGSFVTTDGDIGDQKTLFKIEQNVDSAGVMPYKLTYNDEGFGLYYNDHETYNIWLTLGLEPADPFVFSLWPASIKPPVQLARPHLAQARAMA